MKQELIQTAEADIKFAIANLEWEQQIAYILHTVKAAYYSGRHSMIETIIYTNTETINEVWQAIKDITKEKEEIEDKRLKELKERINNEIEYPDEEEFMMTMEQNEEEEPEQYDFDYRQKWIDDQREID